MGEKINGKLTPIEMDIALDEEMKLLPQKIKLMQIQAKQQYEKRQAYIEAGFTKKEAMELIKTRPINDK